jgi:type IV secretory pathway TrbF-like protein
LTEKIQNDIVVALRAGNYVETAAALAGVNKTTVYDWLSKGARGQGKLFVEFSNAVKRAQAESEARDVATVLQASATNWQAAAWRLERKFPHRWGRKDRLEAEIEHKGSGVKIQFVQMTAAEIASLPTVRLIGPRE